MTELLPLKPVLARTGYGRTMWYRAIKAGRARRIGSRADVGRSLRRLHRQPAPSVAQRSPGAAVGRTADPDTWRHQSLSIVTGACAKCSTTLTLQLLYQCVCSLRSTAVPAATT